MMTRVASTLRGLFGIDVRSLAAFRIGLGALVLLDLVARLPLIEVLYTDQGLLPRDVVTLGPLSQTPFDLYRFAGSFGWAATGIALTFACWALFTIGFRTRWVTAALWVLMSALFRRNQYATDSGDSLVRCFLFWSMFLPLGACWSVDARGRDPTPKVVCTPATAALLLQPALLYFVAGIVKDTPPWRDGSAVLLALAETEWVEPFGIWLSRYSGLLHVMTYATRIVEIVAPLLLFLPIFTLRARIVAIACLTAFQVALASALRLNFFPLYSSVGWLAFVPGFVWARLVARAAPRTVPLPGDVRSPGCNGLLVRARDIVVVAALGVGTFAGLVETEPGLVARTALGLGFGQRWHMYRSVSDDYRRIRTVGTLENGATIDLGTDRGHLLDSPLEEWARSYRVGVVFESMQDADPKLTRPFSRLVCNRWNADDSHPSKLTALTFTSRVVWQRVPRPMAEPVSRHTCEPPPIK